MAKGQMTNSNLQNNTQKIKDQVTRQDALPFPQGSTGLLAMQLYKECKTKKDNEQLS